MINKIVSLIIFMIPLALLSACSDEYSLYSSNGCYVDKIEGGVEVSPQQFAVDEGAAAGFLGWAIDPFGKKSPSVIKVIAVNDQGRPYLLGDGGAGTSRPDVATVFNNQSYAKSGYRVEASLKIPKGSYNLQLNSESDGNIIVCSPPANLVVK